MFKKVLIANRGVRAKGAGVHSCALAHVMGTANYLQAGAAGRAGDHTPEARHV
jgi:hypothetical protein